MSLLTREMPCRELVDLVTEYLEGGLSRRDRRRFEQHLRGCEHCRAYLVQMQLTITATGRLTETQLDPSARDALIEAFRGWKREG